MISPNTYQDIRKLHGPGKGVPDTGGGGDCDNKNSSECRSWKAKKFSEVRFHLSSFRMRPSKCTGKVKSVIEAWITLDFATLSTSPVAPVAFANIVVKIEVASLFEAYHPGTPRWCLLE
jgi:hypothetical protein